MSKKYAVSATFVVLLVLLLMLVNLAPGISTGTTNQQMSSSTSHSTPKWGFKGAYANYSYSASNASKKVSSYELVKITSIGSGGSFTMDTTTGLNSSEVIFFSPGVSNATFSNPGNFPALNITGLSQLNAGRIPSTFTSGFPGAKLKKNVTVSTTAGTFIADEIYGTNKTENLSYAMFIDTTSGIIAKLYLKIDMTPGTGSSNVYMNLTRTNVPMGSSGNSYIWIIVGGVIIASVIAVAGVILIRRRK